MSAAPKKSLTPQEYLAQERKAEVRSEYYRGEVFVRPHVSFWHTLIKDNFVREVGNQLVGTNATALSSTMRIKVESTAFYSYPDIVLVSSRPDLEDNHHDTLLNPTVIVEVLSDSTEKYDRVKKFAHYRQIPSLQEYLLIAQDEPALERYVRQADGTWSFKDFNGLDAILELTSVPVRLPLSEIYAGIEFPEKSLKQSV